MITRRCCLMRIRSCATRSVLITGKRLRCSSLLVMTDLSSLRKFGQFSHFGDSYLDELRKLCLESTTLIDWHYDVVALHTSSLVNEVRLADLTFWGQSGWAERRPLTRIASERHGDHHPLPHAAGKLMRIVVSPQGGSGIETSRIASIAAARASLRERPRCRRSASAICSPTVKTGLSDVIGS